MIACFDVHYPVDLANCAAVVLERWPDDTPTDQFVARSTDVGDYRPGYFYERELKPILELVSRISYPVEFFVIDAYCHLSDSGAPGLGAHLHGHLPDGSHVVGVAKNRFRDTTHAVELNRGGSSRPLFITSIGIDYQRAADYVRQMAGKHRIPAMLKTVDHLARTLEIAKR